MSTIPNWQGQTGLSADCSLPGEIALFMLMEGREHPCDRCNVDRQECRGFPRQDATEGEYQMNKPPDTKGGGG